MANKINVQDMADFFNKLVAEGKGAYEVDVYKQDGGSYYSLTYVEGGNKARAIANVYDKLKSIAIGDN